MDEPPPGASSPWTHLDAAGQVHMVDVSAKAEVLRIALAEAVVRLQPSTREAIRQEQVAKGNVVTAAQLAGVLAAKRTASLIPLCHPIPLSHVEVRIHWPEAPDRLVICATARARAATGVEMEALTAAAVAALTVYDMCKALDRGIEIERIRLIEKQKQP